MLAGESVRSDPAVLGARGDDQIRTGVVGLGTDPVYERRGGSGLAAGYGLLLGLVVCASLGWPYVLVFAVLAGSWAGWKIAGRT